jgi:hypothetical protein
LANFYNLSASEIARKQKAVTDIIAGDKSIGSGYTTQGDSDFEKILLAWTNAAMEQMRQNLGKRKAMASGNLAQSIQPDIKTIGQGGNVKILMLEYWEWLDQGRPPTTSKSKGNPPLQKSIEEWIRMKGIQVRTSPNQNLESRIKSLAFVIARKIHQKGYKAKPFATPVINDKMLQQLSDSIGTYLSIAVLPE